LLQDHASSGHHVPGALDKPLPEIPLDRSSGRGHGSNSGLPQRLSPLQGTHSFLARLRAAEATPNPQPGRILNTHRTVDRRPTSLVSDTGSPIARASAVAPEVRFELATDQEDDLYKLDDDDDDDIDGEDDEQMEAIQEIRSTLERTPRQRLIGNIRLTIDPDAHEVIMGYKRGEGPEIEKFSSSKGSKSHVPEKVTRFPPRTTSLHGSPVTPAGPPAGSVGM
jgi:hypothetical protein